MIPTDGDAGFVANQVLEIYAKPYDPKRPVVCMDEQPVQLGNQQAGRRHQRSGVSTTSTNGRAPPSCSARPCPPGDAARKRRTKADWAEEVASLPEGRYADCEHPCVRQPQHSHAGGVLRSGLRGRGVKRIEFCYTPKHENWLNIAENELSSMTRQCLRHRRLGDTLRAEISAWAVDVNERQRGADWES